MRLSAEANDFLTRVLFIGGVAFILFGIFSKFVIPLFPLWASYVLSSVVWASGAFSDFLATSIGVKRRLLVELNPVYKRAGRWRVEIRQSAYILIIGLILVSATWLSAAHIVILQLLQNVVALLGIMHFTAFANNLREMKL